MSRALRYDYVGVGVISVPPVMYPRRVERVYVKGVDGATVDLVVSGIVETSATLVLGDNTYEAQGSPITVPRSGSFEIRCPGAFTAAVTYAVD